jgi:predicted RNA-binding Zn-ribbon protein involved in translation (DUF1610 family)
MADSTQHCPGLESHKSLKSLICKCDSCGAEKEIFSDELNREHRCDECGAVVDFKKCQVDGQAGGVKP